MRERSNFRMRAGERTLAASATTADRAAGRVVVRGCSPLLLNVAARTNSQASASQIGLNRAGIAVLRFDFHRLGARRGRSSPTRRSRRTWPDLVAAANICARCSSARDPDRATARGAAVLAAAQHCPEARRGRNHRGSGRSAGTSRIFNSTCGHPREGRSRSRARGRAVPHPQGVSGRSSRSRSSNSASNLRKSLLVLHSPTDDLVCGIENGERRSSRREHPKSVSSRSAARIIC